MKTTIIGLALAILAGCATQQSPVATNTLPPETIEPERVFLEQGYIVYRETAPEVIRVCAPPRTPVLTTGQSGLPLVCFDENYKNIRTRICMGYEDAEGPLIQCNLSEGMDQ